MLSKILVAMSVLTFVATAGAVGTVSLVPVDNSDAVNFTDLAVDPIAWAATGYLTYDLVIDTDGEAWTTAYCLATLTDATFWNHPNGDASEMAPDPANFDSYGLTRYDSFFTGYNAYPALGGNLGGPPAAAPGSPLQNTATVREMEWFDNPPLDNIGVFPIARFTFLPTVSDWRLHVVGTSTTPGGPIPPPYFDITIPEPASLALLAVGFLIAARRR